MNTYDPIKYWNSRDYPCCKATVGAITPAQIEYVRENSKNCEKIIDFGPGFGRLFPAYVDAKEVIGYDISSKYKNQIYEESKKYAFNFKLVVNEDIGTIHFPDNSFDSAVASEVFLHQIPDKIVSVMKELSRVAYKVIAISFMNPKKAFGESGSYCFNYDYFKICEKNNLLIENSEVLNHQLYFTYRRQQ